MGCGGGRGWMEVDVEGLVLRGRGARIDTEPNRRLAILALP